MRKARDRIHLCTPAARKDGAFPGDPATPADVIGWEPSKGSQTLPRWCAAGKPAGSPRAWQQWTDEADGRTLPKFVLDELHGSMACGILGRGLAHLYCDACREHHVVAFICKARAVCPSYTKAVTTVVGSPGRLGIVLGPLPAQLCNPAGLAFVSPGELFSTDGGNAVVIAQF